MIVTEVVLNTFKIRPNRYSGRILRRYVRKMFLCVWALTGKGTRHFYKFGIFLNFFSAWRVSAQVFSASLPLGNYKIKSNQPSGATGVEIKSTAWDDKDFRFESGRAFFFFQTGVFVLFSDYHSSISFCRLRPRSSMVQLCSKML